ncbi:GGDEF domain-containing protein [Halomonas sp. GT]|uniref:GGDEF domain-containing protein n=1 Tax=Halomonas sp. GT TaxID=1971364 RepID=UPI0009F31FC8|nr:GGDEF domain-containing protein [Halomonas sp. GT]
MSFMALMVVIVYEARWVYPEIQAYFSQTGNLTGQQLATRSRGYLQLAQQHLLSEQAFDDQQRQTVRLNLDLAYGLIDVEIYRQKYSCTQSSLQTLTLLTERLKENAVTPFDAAAELLGPIDCLTNIEMNQLDLRGMAINKFSKSTRRHNQVLTYSSMVIFALGLLFWLMHERQLRRTERATKQTMAWMQQAMRDPLTGIGNRSALHQDVAAKEGAALALILVDIDFFKQYNDSLGHPEGDQLLRRLASLLKHVLGKDAKLYRLGGDEFAAVLPCDEDAILIGYCEQLTSALEQADFKHPTHPDNERVTLSIGAARFTAGKTTFPSAYKYADKALYQVKSAGRNDWQITVAA